MVQMHTECRMVPPDGLDGALLANKLARQATSAGVPCTTVDELLDLHGRVRTD